MKHVRTWVNEKQFKLFLKYARKRGQTPYALTKELVLQFLSEEHEREVSISIMYWFLLYALAATAVMLLYIF